jgi:two-component system, OmpR family, response regulator MtrA
VAGYPNSDAYSTSRSIGVGKVTRPTRIMIVEDERHIARLLQFVLQKAGYELSVCYSGEQALQEICGSRPDAVVLDLVLPGMTGLDFLRAIRAAPYSCDCIVVTLSGHPLEKMGTELTEAGATAQCSKPIAPSTLLRKLQQLGVQRSRSLEA